MRLGISAVKWCSLVISLSATLLGCKTTHEFPWAPLRVEQLDDGRGLVCYDLNSNGQIDYQQIENTDGRKTELHFLTPGQSDNHIVLLDSIRADEVPHFIIALDGSPYELVEQLYQDGEFRLFYPPSKLISCFPSMTDLAFWRIFGGKQPLAFQAEYFDPCQNKMISGDSVYLNGDNADWAKKLDYRCSFFLDAIAYVSPKLVFEHELKGMRKIFDEIDDNRTALAYSVATAGIGTRKGRDGILEYLRQISRICEQIVHQRKGNVKITLLADHGHNMTRWRRVDFEKRLKKAGYRISEKLVKPNDVVTIKYGLVTYAAFHTTDPAGVADVLIHDPATTIGCYPKGQSVVVKSLAGEAMVHHKNGKYRYETKCGDPLELNEIIKQLCEQGHCDQNGFIDEKTLFESTTEHVYPDPLKRIWFAFNGLVRYPPDLVVCLQDGLWHGSDFFSAWLGQADSTHGSLNRINSTTFLMTMLGETPGVVPLEDVLTVLDTLKKNP